MNREAAEVCFPDRAWHGTARVTMQERLARDTFRLRLSCPAIAQRIVPGQFVMVRVAGVDDPLLGRPLALYDTVLDEQGHPLGIDLVYLIVGKLTAILPHYGAGSELEIWGPLGNGFAPRSCRHLVMVAGGIGQTPFPALAREALGLRAYGVPTRRATATQCVTLCYGARSADLLAGLDDFAGLGVDIRVSTDDGTAGHHGLVTDLLRDVLDNRDGIEVVTCGPEPMLHAVAQLAQEAGVPCRVSLETPMACGLGICFSCVARIRDSHGDWDYRRTCVEGPVFDAEDVVF